MIQTRSKKNPIAGYMGYVPSNQQKQGNYSNQIPQSHIPGYVGYIPSVKAENLYGKTYGKITEDCVRGNYSKGIELPNDIKYKSTTKQTYDHPIKIKEQQLGEGKMNGVKLSTFSTAAKLLMNSSDGFKKKQYTQETVTKLTYQQACKKAYS